MQVRGSMPLENECDKLFHLITDNMLDLITVTDTDWKIKYLSPSFKQTLGYESKDLMNQSSFDFIHPDDRERALRAIRETISKGKSGRTSFRVRHVDGRYIWLETIGKPIFDEEGNPSGAVFSSRNIGYRKEAEQALRTGEEKYHKILDNIDDGYYEVNLAGRFIFFNNVLPAFMGFTREELMNRSFKTAMDDKNAQKVFDAFNRVFRTGESARLVEWESVRKDGSKVYVESSIALIRNAEGKLIGFRGVVRDITERKQFQEKLHQMAVTDQLTGLYNRRGFIALAEQQLKTAARKRKKFLLAFVDIDNMKRINDAWGHLEGDKTLVNAANALRQAFRDSDIIARIGGDEFAILAPEVAETMQAIFMDRLRQQLDVQNAGKHRKYKLSMSIGSVFYDPESPSTLDELMSKTDMLMYDDKRSKTFIKMPYGMIRDEDGEPGQKG